MDKLWYIQTMDHYSAVKRNELLSHKRYDRTLNVLLSERSPRERPNIA